MAARRKLPTARPVAPVLEQLEYFPPPKGKHRGYIAMVAVSSSRYSMPTSRPLHRPKRRRTGGNGT